MAFLAQETVLEKNKAATGWNIPWSKYSTKIMQQK